MPRELVVLGTASQAPTRERNHNGYLLRWDALGLLFDPGEGTQRQLLLASERTSTISHVLITHEHGDHTLGLPGVIQAMSLHRRERPVVLVHPEPAGAFIDRILAVDLYDSDIEIERVPLPVDRATELSLDDETRLTARPLTHPTHIAGMPLNIQSALLKITLLRAYAVLTLHSHYTCGTKFSHSANLR